MKPSWMSPNMYTPVVNDRCNSDRTGENVGHANTHRYGKTISYIDGIKGLRTNCRLASCFVSYVNEHQSDYHGIIWFTFLELLVQCAVNPLLIGGFPYRRSIAWNCVVWLMHFALLVAHFDAWLKVSTLLTQCVVSPFVPILITKEPKLWCLLSCFFQTSCWTNSGDASESKTLETQIMLLLCHLSFSNWWHYCPCVWWNHWSPMDSRCKGSLELNFGGPVCGNSTAGEFPLQKLGLVFSFMFALTSCLTNNRVAGRNTRTRMRCYCYVSFVNPTFRMVEPQDNYADVILKV